MHYNVKETALRFASFAAVTWFSGKRSFRCHRSRAFRKTNQAPIQCFNVRFRFFDTSFKASVSNVTSLHSCIFVFLKILKHQTNRIFILSLNVLGQTEYIFINERCLTVTQMLRVLQRRVFSMYLNVYFQNCFFIT